MKTSTINKKDLKGGLTLLAIAVVLVLIAGAFGARIF